MQLKPNVIIIDDEKDIITNLTDIMAGEDYSVESAFDGMSAIAMCRQKKFDVALIDIKLPDILGNDVARKIIEISPDTECILMTAYASMESAIEAVMQKWVIAYEVKPLDIEHILTLIREILRRKKAEKAHRESEEIFRSFMETAIDMMHMTDTEGFITYVNKSMAMAFGYSEDEMIGMHITRILNKETVEKHYQPVREELMSKGNIDLESVGVTKDRREMNLEIRVVAVYDSDGMFAGSRGVFRDITERKQAEERQKLTARVLELMNKPVESVEVIREVLQAIKEYRGFEAVGIRLTAGNDFPYYETIGFPSKFLEAERYLCAMTPDGQLTRNTDGSVILECMCGNIIRERTNASLPFFTGGGSFWTNSTTRFLASTTEDDRQGHTRNRCNTHGYESVALVPLRSGNNTIGLLQLNDSRQGMFTLEMIAFFERLGGSIGLALANKLAEEELRESEERLNSFMNSATDIFSIWDSELNLKDINKAGIEFFAGLRKEELIGRNMTELMPGVQSAERYYKYLEVIKTGKPFYIDNAVSHPVFGYKHFSAKAFKAGSGLGFISTDITEHMRLYSQLENKTRELESFVYTVSHDLKAPLVSMEGFSSILIKEYQDKLGEKGCHYLDRIQYNVGCMEHLIRDLLELSRIGRVLGQKEAVDIEKVLDEVQEDLRFKLEQDKIRLSLPSPIPKACGDRNRIKQVFENLISNSIQFMGNQKNPSIRVGAEKIEDRFCKFYVKDNGIGVDKKHQEKIFQIFQRLNDIKIEGTGVGLTIVKKIVEHHGGKIWFNSFKGKGSTFYFTLPGMEA